MSMYDTSVLSSEHEHGIMENEYSNVEMNLAHLYGLNKSGVQCFAKRLVRRINVTK